MSFKRALLTATACLLLSACNTMNTHIGDEDAAFGEAVKYNAALQIINPDPVYAEGSAEPGSLGVKGATSVERYRTDKVNRRHRDEVRASRSGTMSTTSDSGGSSSGPQ